MTQIGRPLLIDNGPAKLKSKSMKSMNLIDAQRALRASGMLTVKAAQVRGCCKFGEYLTKIGVVSYGRSLLAFTGEHAKLAVEECERLKTEQSLTPSERVALVRSKKEIMAQLIETADVLLRSASIDTSTGIAQAPPNHSFAPGQAVFPVQATQVNVNVGEKSSPTHET